MSATKTIKQTLAAALLVTAMTWPAAAQEATGNASPPPSVTVIVAKKKQIAENLTATGSFAAEDNVLISPLVEGLQVIEIMAEEGDNVKAGQVLARLSVAEVDIQIAQTKANLLRNEAAVKQAANAIEQARINVDKAAAHLNRTKKLRRSGVSTLEEFDSRQAAFDLAQSQLEGARLSLDVVKAERASIEAQMKDLELRRSRTEIKTPVDGYVSRRNAQLGSIASGAKDPMFNVVDKGVVKLVAEVPESDLPRIKVGLKAMIEVNGFERAIEGVVKLISAEVNETTRIGKVHISLPEGVRIPLGSFGRAQIALANADGVALPLTAVTFGEFGPTVQIVKDGKVEVRKVITGLVGTNDIEVTDGVKPGETYVARAGTFVREGDVVTPVVVESTQ